MKRDAPRNTSGESLPGFGVRTMQWVLVVETCWWQTSVERISDRNALRRNAGRSSGLASDGLTSPAWNEAGDEGRGDRVRETFAGGRTFADESTAARKTLRGRHEVRRPGCVQASTSFTGGARNAAAWRSRVTSSERVARRRRSGRSPVGRSRRGGPRGRDGGRQRRGSVRERLLQQLRGGSAPRCGGESR